MLSNGHSSSLRTHSSCCSARSTVQSPSCIFHMQACFTTSKQSIPRQPSHTPSGVTLGAVRTETQVSPPVSPPSLAASSSSSSHNSPSTSAADLFDDSHFTWSPALILYFPFGCVLALARICLWIAGIALDLPAFRNPDVVGSYLQLLGVKIVWNNVESIPTGKHVLVSNHCSVGDLMMLFHGLPQRYVHLITTALPERVFQTKHLPVVLLPASADTFHALAHTSSATASSASTAATASSYSTAATASNAIMTPIIMSPVASVNHTASGASESETRHLAANADRHIIPDPLHGSTGLHPSISQIKVDHPPDRIQSSLERRPSSSSSGSSGSDSSMSSRIGRAAHAQHPLSPTTLSLDSLSTLDTSTSSSSSSRSSDSSTDGDASDSDDIITSNTVSSRRRTPTTSTRSVPLPEGIDQMPIHLFPEGGMTNGRNGMMAFSRGFTSFAQDTPIVPVALRLHNPLGIRTHTLDSSFAANLFWFSFPPWVELHATALPVMEQEEGEGKAAFVMRLQAAIARELGYEESGEERFSIRQKRQLIQQRAGKKNLESTK